MRNYISICKNISEPATARFHPRQVRFARRICNELGARRSSPTLVCCWVRRRRRASALRSESTLSKMTLTPRQSHRRVRGRSRSRTSANARRRQRRSGDRTTTGSHQRTIGSLRSVSPDQATSLRHTQVVGTSRIWGRGRRVRPGRTRSTPRPRHGQGASGEDGPVVGPRQRRVRGVPSRRRRRLPGRQPRRLRREVRPFAPRPGQPQGAAAPPSRTASSARAS